MANSNVEKAMGMTITNVSFQENGEEKCRIKNIDLQINPGELVMIVGESGAGKTTLLKLMTGLYQPSNGSIAYYGNEARLTTVWQEPRFFRTTVKEYVFRGREARKRVRKSAELVNVTPIIRGYLKVFKLYYIKAVKSFREEKENGLHYCEQLVQIRILLF